MGISRKQIKKAIHRLRVDGKTPHDVIDFINKKLCTNNVEFEEIQNCGDNKILLKKYKIVVIIKYFCLQVLYYQMFQI